MGNGEGKRYAWLLLPIVIVIILVGLLMAKRNAPVAWVLILVLMALFLMVAGVVVSGLARGVLIDERKKISLSRLQTAVWTIVVLSAFLTAALANVASGESDPLAVAIPAQLWVLMGISAAALVGSPLIKGRKMLEGPKTEAGREMRRADTGRAVGVVATNVDESESEWADIFRGEELLNSSLVDLGKIQMFFFTVVLVVAYVAALWEMFKGSAGPVRELPDVAEGMNVLLGISHTAYLTHKSLPRT